MLSRIAQLWPPAQPGQCRSMNATRSGAKLLRAFSHLTRSHLHRFPRLNSRRPKEEKRGATQTTREREERSQRPVAPLGARARAPLRDGVAPRASGCAGAQKLQEVHPPPQCALATSVPALLVSHHQSSDRSMNYVHSDTLSGAQTGQCPQ